MTHPTQTQGHTVTWVEGHISAAHKDAGGRLHGHTWRVRAYWPDDGGCVLSRKTMLAAALKVYDHRELPAALARAEALAAKLGDTLAAVRVLVWRDAEQVGAEWVR